MNFLREEWIFIVQPINMIETFGRFPTFFFGKLRSILLKRNNVTGKSTSQRIHLAGKKNQGKDTILSERERLFITVKMILPMIWKTNPYKIKF